MTGSRTIVLILEDSANRLALMRDVLERRSSYIEVRSFDNAWALRKELAHLLPQVCLISLDFDLSNSSVKSPGDGMDVVQALIRHKPICPIIVHTSLAEDGRTMARALRAGGWRVEQVIFNRREAVAEWLAAVNMLADGLGPNEPAVWFDGGQGAGESNWPPVHAEPVLGRDQEAQKERAWSSGQSAGLEKCRPSRQSA
jgi:CheY-like chemotaxis protein